MSSKMVAISTWAPEEIHLVGPLLDAASVSNGIPRESEEWFWWKFAESPFGNAILTYAMGPAGEIAGVVAFGRYQLWWGKEVLAAGVSYETYVHPEFRRQGLFVRLLREAQDEARSRGLRVLFNFPNLASRRGFEKLGWTNLGGVETWIRPVRPLRMVGAVIRHRGEWSSMEPNAADDASRTLGRSLAGLSRRVVFSRPPDILAAARSDEFLNWRIAAYQRFAYSLVEDSGASAVIRTGRRAGLAEAQLLDIWPHFDMSVKTIRKLLRLVSERTNADVMTILVTRGHPVARLLPRLGFLPTPNRVSFFMYPLEHNVPAPKIAARWALSGLDIHTW